MDTFKAGNVKTFLQNQQQKTKNSEILKIAQGAKILLCAIPPSTVKIRPKFTQSGTNAINNEISKLLQKGVLNPYYPPCYHKERELISAVFETSKSDGGFRLSLNLKSLDEYTGIEHFKMRGLNKIMALVERNCYMAALDIKDAYYSIQVEENSQKYLKYIWKGRLY